MKTEIKYRTFDDLLDSVKLGMRTYDLEGQIDAQQLIKIVAKINYELGLKINPSRSKLLEVVNGKAKLPADFDVMNFALRCGDKKEVVPFIGMPTYKSYCQGMIDGKEYALDLLRETMPKLYEESGISIVPGDAINLNVITHNLRSIKLIVQVFDSNNVELEVSWKYIDSWKIRLISNAVITNARIVIIGGDAYKDDDSSLYPDGCANPTVTPYCNNTCVCLTTDPCTQTPCVTCNSNNTEAKWEFKFLIPIKFEKNKSVSADCFNMNSHNYQSARLKNGFILFNFDEGDVYINYQSLMEDDEGNLLALDHPLCNEYYEYALKERILEDMYLNGENVVQQLQLMSARVKPARNNAISFSNMPDFAEMKNVWDMNRRAQSAKYIDMFKSYYPYSSYAHRQF